MARIINKQNILTIWLLNTLVIIVAAYLLPGIHIGNFITALLIALVLGVLNATLRPILIILTLPLTIVTLGLFLLVINAFMILLASYIVPGFEIDGFWWAVLFSILISIIHLLILRIFKR
jgi:putative membrane protein